MQTGAVRASDAKGRHTTTHRQLIRLPNGTSLIDTPGMREVGMAQVQEGIADTFADILAWSRQCRFSNCRHDSEPGCAIKTTIADGRLSRERWRLYQSLTEENTKNFAKKKEIAKCVKAMKKDKRQEDND